MEFKGTKGKWYVSQPNGKSICADADNALGYEVVVVQDGFMSKYDQKAKANALLASKAPELLEMLNNLVNNRTEILNGLKESKGNYDYEWLFNGAEKLIKEATDI